MKLLANKNALVYGAGGSLGSAIARVFAEAGATLYLSGIHGDKIEQLAKEINAAGGNAFAAQVDALDEKAVQQHIDAINVNIDISFNAVGWKDV